MKPAKPKGPITHGAKACGLTKKSYRAWQAMKNRCLNPKAKDYRYYGGRGITIDPRWHQYEAFLADMGEPEPHMTLDRIEGSKGYNKDNCRWATRRIQSRNRDYCKPLEFEGAALHTWEWIVRLGLTKAGFSYRLQMHRSDPERYPYASIFRPRDTEGAIPLNKPYAPHPSILRKVERAKALRNEGATFTAIAEQLECTTAMARRYVYWDGSGHVSKFTRVSKCLE